MFDSLRNLIRDLNFYDIKQVIRIADNLNARHQRSHASHIEILLLRVAHIKIFAFENTVVCIIHDITKF